MTNATALATAVELVDAPLLYKGKVREGPNRNAAFMRPIGEIPLCVGTEHAGDARCSVPTSSTVRFDQLLRASLQAVA